MDTSAEAEAPFHILKQTYAYARRMFYNLYEKM